MAVMGLFLCVVGLFYPAPKFQNPMALAVSVWPGCETFIIARQRGIIKRSKINYVEMSWSSAAMGAFEKRVVDAAVVSLDELIRLNAGGQNPRAVLVLGISKGADAIMAKPEINSLENLRGRRVGVELRSMGEYFLAQSLYSVGMSLSDVEIVPLNLAETESSYDENDLDAVVTADPWRVRLEGKGARVLVDSSGLDKQMTRVLVVRADTLESFQSEVQELVNTHFKISEMSATNGYQDEEISVILRRESLPRKLHDLSMTMIHMPSREENINLLGPGPQGLKPVLEQMAKFMEKTGLLERTDSLSDLIDDRFVKEGK